MIKNIVVSTMDFGQKSLRPPIKDTTTAYRGYIDSYKKIRRPDDYDLLNEYQRIAYSCANLNANAVAVNPLKLYVASSNSDKSCRWPVKKLKNKDIDKLVNAGVIKQKDFKNIEEVVVHPVIELLDKVNSFPGFFRFKLFKLTQLYLECLGRCYWYVRKNILGVPVEIWILPSQHVIPKQNKNSTRMIDYYDYQYSDLQKPKRFELDEIIPIFVESIQNPYVDALSGMVASFQEIRVSNQLIAHEQTILNNQGRPDVVISPGKDNPLDTDTANNWRLKWDKEFSRGGAGRAFFAEEEMTVTPLNYSPEDLGKLQIAKSAKIGICNCFEVPFGLLETENLNRAVLDALLILHARNTIKPRCIRLEGILNEELITKFDESGRLFLAYDDPVPEDRQEKVTEISTLVMSGIMTPQEGRDAYNLPEIDDPTAHKLRPINVSPDLKRDQSRRTGEAEK